MVTAADGRVEQDPANYVAAVHQTTEDAVAQVPGAASRVVAIGLPLLPPAARAHAQDASRVDPQLSSSLRSTSTARRLVNLRPAGDPDTPAEWNDGRWVQAAWAARRAGSVEDPASSDPNAATSVPPPSR